MKQIFVARHPTEAHLVKGLLEAEGIPADIRGERLFAVRGEVPVTPDTLPTVWVDDDRESDARALLADFDKTTPRSGPVRAWTCRNCGEEVESQFLTCWKCGAERDMP